jgi:hypothetical protein
MLKVFRRIAEKVAQVVVETFHRVKKIVRATIAKISEYRKEHPVAGTIALVVALVVPAGPLFVLAAFAGAKYAKPIVEPIPAKFRSFRDDLSSRYKQRFGAQREAGFVRLHQE